eukprot:15485497-Alexandrium_andersonii.AAC.1
MAVRGTQQHRASQGWRGKGGNGNGGSNSTGAAPRGTREGSQQLAPQPTLGQEVSWRHLDVPRGRTSTSTGTS